jgi:hypothetical protein
VSFVFFSGSGYSVIGSLDANPKERKPELEESDQSFLRWSTQESMRGSLVDRGIVLGGIKGGMHSVLEGEREDCEWILYSAGLG